jgi:hypothetical protein
MVSSAHSDRTGERRWHIAGPALAGALGFAASASLEHPALALASLSLAALGIWSALGPFWTLPPSFLAGTAAAGGIALINSVGNLGGFAGPYALGLLREATGSFAPGLLLLAQVPIGQPAEVFGLIRLAVAFSRGLLQQRPGRRLFSVPPEDRRLQDQGPSIITDEGARPSQTIGVGGR